jgi:hypothetical protein
VPVAGKSTCAAPNNDKASSRPTPIGMRGSSHGRNDHGGARSAARVASSPPRPLPPRGPGHSGFQLKDRHVPCVPPPLPQVEGREDEGTFSAARRSQPPPRKHRSEAPREMPGSGTPRSRPAGPVIPSSRAPRTTAETRPPSENQLSTRAHDLEQVGARCVEFDPGTSELWVSKGVWCESPRLAPDRRPGARLAPRAWHWLPTSRRRLSGAIHWLYERPLWQRCTICFGVGSVLGLSLVLAAAAVGRGRSAPKASAPVPQANVLAALAVPTVVPTPVAISAVTPVATATVSAAQEQAAPELPLEEHKPKPARKHAKPRHPRHRDVGASGGAWTFPRPQRRLQ